MYGRLIVVIVLFFTGSVQSQALFSYESNWPWEYHSQAGLVQSKISIAKLERIPNTFVNPANNAFLLRPTAFAGLQKNNHRYTLSNEWEPDVYDIHPEQDFVPGYFAVALPFAFAQKKWAIAVSYNGIAKHDLDDLLEKVYQNLNNTQISQIFKTGSAQSASAAISIKMAKNIALGLAVTKRFGKVDWSYKNYGKTIQNYSSHFISTWINGKLGKFRLASAFTFPHKILEFQNTFESWFLSHQVRTVTVRRSKGSAMLGVSYKPISPLTFGINYGFQPGIEDKIEYTTLTSTRKYGKSTVLSGGIEYDVHISHLSIPIYAGYKMTSSSKDDNPVRMSDFTGLDETEDVYGEILFGAQIKYKNMAIYFDGLLGENKYKFYDALLPPWS